MAGKTFDCSQPSRLYLDLKRSVWRVFLHRTGHVAGISSSLNLVCVWQRQTAGIESTREAAEIIVVLVILLLYCTVIRSSIFKTHHEDWRLEYPLMMFLHSQVRSCLLTGASLSGGDVTEFFLFKRWFSKCSVSSIHTPWDFSCFPPASAYPLLFVHVPASPSVSLVSHPYPTILSQPPSSRMWAVCGRNWNIFSSLSLPVQISL